jgi:hypothetical protein
MAQTNNGSNCGGLMTVRFWKTAPLILLIYGVGQRTRDIVGEMQQHPCTPNLGQGGGMALEDAAMFAKCITNENTPEAALEAL